MTSSTLIRFSIVAALFKGYLQVFSSRGDALWGSVSAFGILLAGLMSKLGMTQNDEISEPCWFELLFKCKKARRDETMKQALFLAKCYKSHH